MSTDAIIVDPEIIYGVLVTMYFRRAAMFREEITSCSKRKVSENNKNKCGEGCRRPTYNTHTPTYCLISE